MKLAKILSTAAILMLPTTAFAAPVQCSGLPAAATDSTQLAGKLKNAVASAKALTVGTVKTENIGFQLQMWATVVAKDGTVCAVAYSGSNATEGQWLGSRVISAQKASTGNYFSLGNGNGPAPVGKAGFAISSANLYSATQPGGSLFGLQHSNPVWSAGAYGDRMGAGGVFGGELDAASFGTNTDPMIGQRIGGVNVFGGALGLYDVAHNRVGGVGVSGDTSCMDHIVAWFLRKELGLDNLKGVFGFASLYAKVPDTTHPDNIIFDIAPNTVGTSTIGGTGVSFSAYGHPVCKGAVGNALGNPLPNDKADALVRALPSALNGN